MTDWTAGPVELFGSEHQTPGGWRLPLTGNLTSYVYVGLLDFAFEIWLGGDYDVTVRLARIFSFGRGDDPPSFDPRANRKSELGALLELGQLVVAEFVVERTGDLRIMFTDGRRLTAHPADDGPAWRLEWPVAGPAGVAAGMGGGLTWAETGSSPR